MQVEEICRNVTIDGQTIQVLVGEHVWWFNQNQTTSPPVPAIIQNFGGDNMVDLAYMQISGPTAKWMAVTGVCLIGDERLDNVNYRKRGSWCPRGPWAALDIKA